ncbi:MAG TPA: hypothetical protein VGY58_12560 [Gemmataceae bacterium]|nr:hypothetical protein [Gemmataceae bacterium]
MLANTVRAGVLLGMILIIGCIARDAMRPYRDAPPDDLKPTRIDFADNDAFDALFETALTNQDPVILIQTTYDKPEWDGRLSGWIAAWNMGGKVEAAHDKRKMRFQAGIPSVQVDGDSIREFRLLMDDFMDRVEQLAKETSAWWAEEKVRSRRIALLKPYNLRFNKDEDKSIQLIFFNGRYAERYGEWMRTVAHTESDGQAETWARVVTCSRCKFRRSGEGTPIDAPPTGSNPGQLTGATKEK